jgi:hypothetical protein
LHLLLVSDFLSVFQLPSSEVFVAQRQQNKDSFTGEPFKPKAGGKSVLAEVEHTIECQMMCHAVVYVPVLLLHTASTSPLSCFKHGSSFGFPSRAATLFPIRYTKGMREVLRNLDLTAGQGLHRQPAGARDDRMMLMLTTVCWRVLLALQCACQ